MINVLHKVLYVFKEPWRLRLYFRFFYCKLFLKHFVKKWGNNTVLQSPIFCSYRHLSLGNNVSIGHHSRIEAISSWLGISYNPEIIIEDGVSIEQRLHLVAASKIVIGANSTISFDVMITDIDHEYEKLDVGISFQPLRLSKTTIGCNCFIGAGAKILAGTVLGTQCIVGANSVVRGSFPSYCMIAGSPARIVKQYDHVTQSWKSV